MGPRDCAQSGGWKQGAGRLRGRKHTSALLLCPRGGENTATEFAKYFFSWVKSGLPFLVTWVDHGGEVLTFQGLRGALSEGLSFSGEGVGCSPTDTPWANKR